jgi:hypothetical protein
MKKEYNGCPSYFRSFKKAVKAYANILRKYRQVANAEEYGDIIIDAIKDYQKLCTNFFNEPVVFTLLNYPLHTEAFIEKLLSLPRISHKELLRDKRISAFIQQYPEIYLKYYLGG